MVKSWKNNCSPFPTYQYYTILYTTLYISKTHGGKHISARSCKHATDKTKCTLKDPLQHMAFEMLSAANAEYSFRKPPSQYWNIIITFGGELQVIEIADLMLYYAPQGGSFTMMFWGQYLTRKFRQDVMVHWNLYKLRSLPSICWISWIKRWLEKL